MVSLMVESLKLTGQILGEEVIRWIWTGWGEEDEMMMGFSV